MTLALRRVTRLDPDTFVEELHVGDDGEAVLWRSAGWATQPPTAVGRFGRRLDGPGLASLERAVAAVADAGDLRLPPPPGGAADSISAGPVEARVSQHAEPEGPWASVLRPARLLLVELTSWPQAALDLRFDGGGLRLLHLGDGPLAVGGTQAWARADRVDHDGTEVAEWHCDLINLPSSIGPGWSLPIALPPELHQGPGELRGFAFLSLVDGGDRRPVSLEAR